MSADERRSRILALLKAEKRPLSGGELAKMFGVTRQIIVQDIAILRASGNDIIATSRGYMAAEPVPLISKKVAVRHGDAETRDELMTFIECGCRVLDVIVEHPLYGELHGMLMLKNSSDVEEFMEKVKRHGATLLSRLTGGVHLHTVEALNEDSIKRAEDVLRKKGILLK
jgi:hypothetical protein